MSYTRLITCFAAAMLLVLPLKAQLHINEVDPQNSVVTDPFGETDDWIEIYNAGGSPVDLAGYYLSDDPGNPVKWQIPSSLIVPAGGFLLLWADEDTEQGVAHLDFKMKSGEVLSIFNPSGVLVDTMSLSSVPEGNTRGRYPDGDSNLVIFPNATPGASNSQAPRVSAPLITPPSGGYAGSVTVTLSSPEGGTILYTLDGTDPRVNGQVYNGPLTFSDTSSLRAIGRLSGYDDSIDAAGDYLIDSPHDIAVVMITSDPHGFYDDADGIYVVGTNGINGPCASTPRNYNQDWQRDAHVSLIEPDGTLGFTVPSEVEISGGCSRRRDKKSLNVGFDEDVEYKLFPTQEETSFGSMKLRTGGNADRADRLRDAIAQQVIKDELDVDTQAWRPAAVYLNGEYFGYFSIRDRLNGDYFDTYYPDVGDLDRMRMPLSDGSYIWYLVERVQEGSNVDYQNLYNHLAATDFANNQAAYEALYDWIDMNSFMDFTIAQTYHRNADWPGNNNRVWRERAPRGRWRWAMGDTGDFMFSSGGHTNVDLIHDLFIEPGVSNQLNVDDTLPWVQIGKNESFRHEFAQRANTYIHTVWDPARVDSIIDPMILEAATEMDRDAAEWGSAYSGETSFLSQSENSRTFYQNRGSYYRTMIETDFLGGWNDYFNMTVNYNDAMGDVYFHNNHFHVEPGHNADYFETIPIHIRAVPKPGYRFVRWENGFSGTNPNIHQAFTDNLTTLVAVFEAAPGLDLEITEIHYHPTGTNGYEFIEIHNPDSQTRYLGGHQFTNGIGYTFPHDASIAPGETIIVARDPSLFNLPGVQVFGARWFGGLDKGGEKITLATAAGDPLVSFSYNDAGAWPEDADGLGGSLELKSFGLDPADPANWQASAVFGGTPGAVNSSPSGVVINEVMARDLNGLDWIELHNTSGSSVNVGGWLIGTDLVSPSTGAFVIPGGTSIPAGGFLTFDENQMGFGFADAGSDLFLANGSGGQATGFEDVEDIGVSIPGISFGRWTSSNGAVDVPPLSAATPGAANASPYLPDLRIVELMTKPLAGNAEYIKLTNPTGLPVNLFDPSNAFVPWAFTDGVDYTFPQFTTIGPCETIFICDTTPALFRNQYGIPFSTRVFGPWDGRLDNGGETLKLRQPVLTLADGSTPMARAQTIRYEDAAPWPTVATNDVLSLVGLNDYVNDPGSWNAASPDPTDAPCLNYPPVLRPRAPATIQDRTLYRPFIIADDPEGDPYEILLDAGAPSGASINPTNNRFLWTPSDAQGPGTYTFDLIVRELSAVPRTHRLSWTITVEDSNDAPVITPIAAATIPDRTPFSRQIQASDPEGDGFTFQLSGAPAGASITAGGLFTWTPTDAQGPGSYTFDVVATDSALTPKSSSASWTITVQDSNDAPVITPIAAATIADRTPFSRQVQASDPEGDAFTFQLSGAPAGASITAGGQFTWTPTDAQGPGSYTFDVVATDAAMTPQSSSASWTITVQDSNGAPVFTPLGPTTIPDRTPFSQQVQASDPEGDAITFQLSAAPAGASITAGGLFTWTPTDAQGPGSYTFGVVATDSALTPQSSTASWTINVQDSNGAPAITPITAATIPDRVPFSRQIQANDPEGDAITFQLGGAPAGASITPGGLFTWVPTDAQGPGSYTFNVVATDDAVPPRSSTASWTITVFNSNNPPAFSIGNYAETIDETVVWVYRLNAQDADFELLQYSLTGAPAGMSLDPATGWLRWLPGDSAGGQTYTFQAQVEDPSGDTDSQSIELTVTDLGQVQATGCNDTDVLVPASAAWQYASGQTSSAVPSPLAEYSFDANLANNTLDLSAANTLAGVTASDVVPGPGFSDMSATTGSAFVNETQGLDDGTADNMQDAVDVGEYIAFSLSAPGLSLNLEQLTFDFGRNNNGAQDFAVRSNVDGFTTDLLLGNNLGTGVTPQTVDLSAAAFDALTQIEFRIYFDDRRVNNSSSSGTYVDNLVVTGVTQPLDEFWAEPWHDTTGWNTGTLPAGYGESGLNTTLPSGNVRALFRHAFIVNNRHEISELTLRFQRDDGAVAYLNGQEVTRSNMPAGPLDATTTAATSVFGAGEKAWQTITIPVAQLAEGWNELAVSVHQIVASSSDMWFDAELTAQRCSVEVEIDAQAYRDSGMLQWESQVGQTYVIEQCLDLIQGQWTDLQTVTATSSLSQFTPPHINVDRCFFRIRFQ